eukprot:6097384-Ditylum_brightwellii.AAC.1
MSEELDKLDFDSVINMFQNLRLEPIQIMAAPALSADQIAATASAAIQTAGLIPGEQTFLDNSFAEEINLATKNGLSLFNAATAAVPTEK